MPIKSNKKNKPNKPGKPDKPEDDGGSGGGQDESEIARDMSLTPPHPAFITIQSGALENPFVAMLGDGEVGLTGGLGGFGPTDRPRNKSITEWPGVEPYTLTIPLMLDDWTGSLPGTGAPRERKAARQVELIRKASQPQIKEGKKGRLKVDEPAKLRLYGFAVPEHLQGEKMAVSTVEWGIRLVDELTGETLRQAVVMTFMEFEKSDDYKIGKTDAKHPTKKQYTVKEGETLKDIAKKFYDDPDKWKKIAQANDLHGPRSVKAGDKVLIP